MRDVIPLPTPETHGREPLSPRQADVLAVLRAWHAVRGEWPSQRDLCKALRPPIAVRAMNQHISALRRKEYLACHGSRALEVITGFN